MGHYSDQEERRKKEQVVPQWVYAMESPKIEDNQPLRGVCAPSGYQPVRPIPQELSNYVSVAKYHCNRGYEVAQRLISNSELDIPIEMLSFISVLEHSANIGKYPANNWLNKDGHNQDLKSTHASMFRHLAASAAGQRVDKDNGMDPLLMLAARAMMLYYRVKNNIVHPLDEKR